MDVGLVNEALPKKEATTWEATIREGKVEEVKIKKS